MNVVFNEGVIIQVVQVSLKGDLFISQKAKDIIVFAHGSGSPVFRIGRNVYFLTFKNSRL